MRLTVCPEVIVDALIVKTRSREEFRFIVIATLDEFFGITNGSAVVENVIIEVEEIMFAETVTVVVVVAVASAIVRVVVEIDIDAGVAKYFTKIPVAAATPIIKIIEATARLEIAFRFAICNRGSSTKVYAY